MDDALKLTTYLGERDRSGDRFLADALLDVYARHELRISLLLRGALGFGLKHHLRSDRLLTLSEDLPVVTVAVDAPERIEAVVGEVRALQRSGVVTLERARLLADPVELDEPAKLTIYVGRRERPAYAAICESLRRHGAAGATVLLGVDGTVHGVRRRAGLFARNAAVPMMIVAVGDAASLSRALPELGGQVTTLERIRVCKRDGVALAAPHAPADGHVKLMVYGSEQDRHEQLVRRLRAGGATGATTLRGVWGFHGDHAAHGDRLLQLRRRVPAVTIVVEQPERAAAAYAVIDELTAEHGLVTSELVPRLNRP